MVESTVSEPVFRTFQSFPIKTTFLFSMLFATLSTTILYPAFPIFFRPTPNNEHLIYIILGWFSTAHVATTAFFYADKDFMSHIVERKMRYIWTPLLFVGGSILVWGLLGKANHNYLWFFFTSWLLWHYQRQNVGIFSLITKMTETDRISLIERRILLGVGVAGIIAALRFKAHVIPFVTDKHLYAVGLGGYFLAVCMGVYLVYKRIRLGFHRNVVAIVFFVSFIGFFAPTFIANGFYPAVTSYAVAHALQYWLLMTYLVFSSKDSNGTLRALGGFVVLVFSVWGVIYFSRQEDLWGSYASYFIGLQFGITLAHFIIDADAWRLRETFQRNYIFTRYSKLFSR